jgi:FkbM family methyltransferase
MIFNADIFETDEFVIRIHPDALGRKADLETINEIHTGDAYRLRQLASATSNVWQIVDIGAHIGTFTMLAGKLFPHAWVWAFEPNLAYYPYLLMNAPHNSSPINLAIIGFYGQKLDREFYPGNADEVLWRARAGGAISVSALRSMCPRIDLLKIDCEQSEVEILREMEALGMVKDIPVIVGEWHYSTAREEVSRILSPTHHLDLNDVGEWNQFYATRK